MRLSSFIFVLFFLFAFTSFSGFSQSIPKSYSQIKSTSEGLNIEYQGKIFTESEPPPLFTLDQAKARIKGSKEGLKLNFNDNKLNGRLYYGFIPNGDSKHPHPVYFRRYSDIEKGKADIPIAGSLEGRFDMVGWQKQGHGTLGYRIVDAEGLILYDGKVTFTSDGKFKVAPTLIEGPFVNLLGPDSAVISYYSSEKVASKIILKGPEREERLVMDDEKKEKHEVHLTGLKPGTSYSYSVEVGPRLESYDFHTAPAPGSRSPFTFAYASDSRNGQGGGERNVHGANFYIMKKIMALARLNDIRFFQFSGDLINGYLTNTAEMRLQYANWKRAIEPFAHYFPVYISMGNHEALMKIFNRQGDRLYFLLDRWPYETESAEAIFGDEFVMPTNGPESEDGADYDPSPSTTDFPSYKENVFSYTYDNVAVIVLNSDYWYSPTANTIPLVSGGLHGYIMDQQVKWLEKQLDSYEKDESIDHIFLTQHTPFFPNGGHVKDDMWYDGDNEKRPFVAGRPLAKGIIQRRDDLLELIVNKSQKVRAILTGDEHNYARTEVGPDTPIYPEGYPENQKISLQRSILQINNGAAGAPYYAQEETPWSDYVNGFTTQNALVLFDVEGKSIQVRVLNPDTLEEIERFDLTNN